MSWRKTLTDAEKDEVVRRYLEVKQSQNVIAFALGTSQATVSKILHARGIAVRPGGAKHFKRYNFSRGLRCQTARS